jgi:SAM-dependent methyltransferase
MVTHAIPDNVALYQRLHALDPLYQRRNNGIDYFDHWCPMLEGVESVLEIGCGNGQLCQRLTIEGKQVMGIDLVAGPYTREGYDFAVCDVTCQNPPTDFDLVCAFDLLEHIETDQVPKALTNIGQTADRFVFTIAGFGNPPIHPTVKSPGWWLNALFNNIPVTGWAVSLIPHYSGRPLPVYLFMGVKNDE